MIPKLKEREEFLTRQREAIRKLPLTYGQLRTLEILDHMLFQLKLANNLKRNGELI